MLDWLLTQNPSEESKQKGMIKRFCYLDAQLSRPFLRFNCTTPLYKLQSVCNQYYLHAILANEILKCLECFSMYCSPCFFVILFLWYPHLLKGVKRSQDGAPEWIEGMNYYTKVKCHTTDFCGDFGDNVSAILPWTHSSFKHA